jgi:hypothetical protein
MHKFCFHIKEESDIKEATGPCISILCFQNVSFKYFCDNCIIKVTAPLVKENMCFQEQTFGWFYNHYQCLTSQSSVCCLLFADFFLGLPFNPDNGGDMFIGWFTFNRLHGVIKQDTELNDDTKF